MLHLSSTDIAAVNAISRTLSAPLDFDGLDAWRAAANRQLRELIGSDSAGFLLATSHELPMFSEDHPPAVLRQFLELTPPPLSDGTPIWQRMIEMGATSLATAYGDELPDYLGSAYYNDYAHPGGAVDTLAVSVRIDPVHGCPHPVASIHLWNDRHRERAFGEREIGLVSLLLPALQAGVDGWLRFGSQGTTLLRMLDDLGQAVLACDVEGRVTHETPALSRMLEQDPAADCVRRMMALVARRVATGDVAGTAANSTDLRTGMASYRMHACRYRGGPNGEPLVLVAVQRAPEAGRSRSQLFSQFGLTPGESRVAQLLADGARNAAIAAELGISEHTARRHTERILSKLGAHSRAEAAARLAR